MLDVDKFKTTTGISRVYSISKENFLIATGEKELFVKEKMKETIDFCVYQGSAPNIKTIYRKTIEINIDYFINLTLKDETYRSAELLKIAQDFKQRMKY